MAEDFEGVGQRTPTSVGHTQLVLNDGRRSDKAGAIIAGVPADISVAGAAFVLDQDDQSMVKRRAADARPHLSPAGQQKLLDVLNELRVNIGPVLLP